MKIEKAVIPVAGLGTRLLPASKSQPKEMLPVGHKPVVQHVVEDLAHHGLRDVLFITGWKKRAIEDHFDDSPELVQRLTGKNQWELLDTLDPEGEKQHFYYARQKQARGLGDAILYAEHFVGEIPFVVALGDAIIEYTNHSNLLHRLIEVHLKHGNSATVAVEEVPDKKLGLYGVVKPTEGADPDAESFQIEDVVEKPSVADAPSHYAISARYVFSPIIFRALRQTAQSGGEVGLSHAIRQLIHMGAPVRCVKLSPEETRFDIGNYETYFKTFIHFALQDKECGPEIREYVRKELGIEV
ncbi:MAG: UTP--glucose-1-phosphate uridylyltransferase [Candidatus Latescibacterota bacterium]